ILFDSSLTESAVFTGDSFNFSLTTVNTAVYMTLMKTDAIEPIENILRNFIRYLNLPIITVQNVSLGNNRTSIQYQSVCFPDTYGFMWIVPNSVFTVYGLTEFPNTQTAFGFPTGRGLFLTTPFANVITNPTPVNFYTVWQNIIIPNDFSYQIPFTNIGDRRIVLNDYNDMYELSMSLRIIVATGLPFLNDYLNACVTYWKTELNTIQYNNTVVYFNSMGTELGVLSK